jgi:Rieske Fe-S protein
MTRIDEGADWLEQGLHTKIPVHYQRTTKGKGYVSKSEALDNLRRVQRYIGYLMFLSAGAGVYLLATDGSLWILAISHAIGLILIVVLDVFLGWLNVMGSKRIYIASLAAAVLAIVLQLGDIMTAPQYNMTPAYFASYLFGLPAFDLLLILQGAILLLGVASRGDLQFLASRRRIGRELNYSRRSFVLTLVGFASLIGFGVALGSVKIPAPSSSSSPASSAPSATPSTAITNTNALAVNSPVYFDYPSGYPNVLFKRSDGTLVAFSLLCTHVCCETTYLPSQNEFYCPCHGSVFDGNGRVVRGPAYTPLPSIALNVDSSGNIFPTGVSGATPC